MGQCKSCTKTYGYFTDRHLGAEGSSEPSAFQRAAEHEGVQVEIRKVLLLSLSQPQ